MSLPEDDPFATQHPPMTLAWAAGMAAVIALAVAGFALVVVL